MSKLIHFKNKSYLKNSKYDNLYKIMEKLEKEYLTIKVNNEQEFESGLKSSNVKKIRIDFTNYNDKAWPRNIIALNKYEKVALVFSTSKRLGQKNTMCSIQNLELFSSIDTLEEIHIKNIIISQKVLNNLSQLNNLKKLSLINTYKGQVLTLPQGFKQLEYINLDNNDLKIIPTVLATYKNLQSFSFRANKAIDWDKSLDILAQLPKLENLDLSNYQLTSLPSNILKMTQIKSLNIRRNKLCNIPEELKLLKNIEQIHFSYSEYIDYEKLFSIIASFPLLKKLEINRFIGHNLPENLGLVTQVEELIIQQSKIKVLPQSIKHLKNLKRLIIRDCPNFIHLDKNIGNFTNLSYIELYKNKQLDCNEAIEILSSLKQKIDIKICCPKLTKLPESIIKIHAIRKLDIDDMDKLEPSNVFTTAAKLSQLEEISFMIQDINLPDEFQLLSNINKINIHFNLSKYNSNKNTKLPLAISTYNNIHCKSNYPDYFEGINTYFQHFRKIELNKEKRDFLFYYLSNNFEKLLEIHPNPLLADDFKPNNAVFYIAGKIEGFPKKDIMAQLKDNGITCSTNLNKKVNYVILGKKVKKNILERIITNENISIIIIDQYKHFVWEKDTPFLMDEESADMNENIVGLLFSTDDENIKIALQMLEGGGVTNEIISYLLAIHIFHNNKSIRKEAEDLFKKFASAGLQHHFYQNKKKVHDEYRYVSYVNKELFKIMMNHPEIHTGNFIVMYERLRNQQYGILHLNWSHKICDEIPKSIKYLTEIETIFINREIDWNKSLEALKHLPNLMGLGLSYCGLTKIPEKVFEIKSLKTLNLDDNKLTTIPESVSKLVNLEAISLSKNQFDHLPEALSKLPKLKTVWIGNNKITSIDTLSLFNQLEEIHLGHNNIKAISADLGKCVNLKRLCIEKNKISSITHEFGKMTALEYLDISYNKIKKLPECLNFKNLIFCNLKNNKIFEIPVSFQNSLQLKTLILDNNKIQSIPKELEVLKCLETLSICKNQISVFPEVIYKLIKLKEVNLSENNISEIPQKLLDQLELSIII